MAGAAVTLGQYELHRRACSQGGRERGERKRGQKEVRNKGQSFHKFGEKTDLQFQGAQQPHRKNTKNITLRPIVHGWTPKAKRNSRKRPENIKASHTQNKDTPDFSSETTGRQQTMQETLNAEVTKTCQYRTAFRKNKFFMTADFHFQTKWRRFTFSYILH